MKKRSWPQHFTLTLARAALAVVLFSPAANALVGVEEIAQALVQSSYGGNLNYESGAPSSRIKDAQFVMRANHTDLPSIEKYGFLNLYQSQRSNGVYVPLQRQMVEGMMVGMSLPNEPKALFPKYGTVHMDRDDGLSFPYNARQYGNIVFVFNRRVLKRMTWSPIDSLGAPDEVHPITREGRLPVVVQDFPEGQVWGDLDLSDVEMIVLDSGVSKFLEPDVVRLAERNGLDVYRYSGRVGENSRTLRSRDMSRIFKSQSSLPYVNRVLQSRESLKRASGNSDLNVSSASPPLLYWLSVVAPEFIPESRYSNFDLRKYRHAREHGIEGLSEIYKRAEGRPALKAAILRYVRSQDWIPAEDKESFENMLKEDGAATEVRRWVRTWQKRHGSLPKLQFDVPESCLSGFRTSKVGV